MQMDPLRLNSIEFSGVYVHIIDLHKESVGLRCLSIVQELRVCD